MRKFSLFFLAGILLLQIFQFNPAWGEDSAWHVLINIPECRLHLYKGKNLYKSYYVAVGKPNKPSPIGKFSIINKVVNPTWYPPDGRPAVPPGPGNPLGKYWMGLSTAGYGIHGNSAAWSIGTPASLGCFRMDNQDIREVFSLLPVGTAVDIIYETVYAGLEPDNQAWLRLYPDIYHRGKEELAVKEAIDKLNWCYQPHWKALQYLLQVKRPVKILIPRMIKVEGDQERSDGFYWNGSVFLTKNGLWQVINEISNGEKDHSRVFSEYLSLAELRKIYYETEDYIWLEQENTVKIRRFRLMVNGIEVPEGIKKNDHGELWINLVNLAKELELPYYYNDHELKGVIAGREYRAQQQASPGWLGLRAFLDGWPGAGSYWNASSYILNIELPLAESFE